MFSCLTCDVEVESTKNIDELKAITSLIDYFNVKCTFFIEISHKNHELYSEIVDIFKNHEIGLHIHWGNKESYTNGLEEIPIETMRMELENSLNLLKELGFNPISFRGGGLCCTNSSLMLLKEYGFKIDSSVAARLDEKEGWFQGHSNVPYIAWYFPSKQSYSTPTNSIKNKIEILEVPVTRMIPAGKGWFPYTLTPVNPFFKLIIYEWILKSQRDSLTLVTPIFHSWGEGKLRNEKFPLFLKKLEKFIRFLIYKDFEFLEIKDLLELIP